MKTRRRLAATTVAAVAATAAAIVGVAAGCCAAEPGQFRDGAVAPVAHASSAPSTGQVPQPSSASPPADRGSGTITPTAADTFVDCHRGRDTSSGTAAAPLRSVTRATSRSRRAGTTIWLVRGCTWDGPVTIRANGTASAPITLAAYGAGAAPTLTATTLGSSQSLLQLAGSYLQVVDLHVAHTAGIGVNVTGSHGTVRDTEIDDVGTGVWFAAPFGRALRVRTHDLHMTLDTPGGDDDHGAVGYTVVAPDVEIANSSCVNCRASSHDYGHDGGFAEIWNSGDRLSVHDNTGQNTQGILEIGGNRADASARGVTVRQNSFREAHGGFWIHSRDAFGIAIADLTVSGNEISDTCASDTEVLGGDLRHLTFEGNTVTTPGQVTWSGPPAHHRWNTFHVARPASVGYPLDTTETVVSPGPVPGTCN